MTGRLADGWNPSLPYLPPEEAVAARDVVRRAAEQAGREPDAIECAYNVAVHVGTAMEASSRLLAGEPGPIAERIASFVRLGFTTINLWARGGSDQLELAATEIVPAVHALLS